MTQLELSYKTLTIGIFRFFNLSDDWMLQLALKHDKEKGSYSVLKEAREFACEIELDLETEIDGEMKNTEKGKKAFNTAWKSKHIHGQYPLRSQKADIDLHDTHQWLRSAGLKEKTKGLLLPLKIRTSSLEILMLIFLKGGMTLGVDSIIQAPRLLTT